MQEFNCLIVKTSSEMSLKTHFVKQFFVKKLVEHIKLIAKKHSINIEKIDKAPGRLFIFSSPDLSEKLGLVFGIHSIAKAFNYSNPVLEEIQEKVLLHAKNFLHSGDSFKLSVQRRGQHSFSSKDTENLVGKQVLNSIPGLKVNLSKPVKTIFIEIHPKEFFIFFEEVSGLKGLPLGVEGNCFIFSEARKEDLIAAWLLMKRGCNIFPISSEENHEAVEKLFQKLVSWNSFRDFKVHSLNEVPALMEKYSINAVVFSKQDFNVIPVEEKFKEYDLMILYPLMFLSQQKKNDLMKLIFSE